MKITFKIIWTVFFVIVMYFILAVFALNYIEWLMKKEVLWIIVILILTVLTARIVLNKIPLILGNLSSRTDTTLTIIAFIDRGVKILFFFIVIRGINIHESYTIISGILCFMLFYAFCNFLNQGLFSKLLKSEIAEI